MPNCFCVVLSTDALGNGSQRFTRPKFQIRCMGSFFIRRRRSAGPLFRRFVAGGGGFCRHRRAGGGLALETGYHQGEPTLRSSAADSLVYAIIHSLSEASIFLLPLSVLLSRLPEGNTSSLRDPSPTSLSKRRTTSTPWHVRRLRQDRLRRRKRSYASTRIWSST